ncbi:pentatricopeptide repeat-containing protein At3g09040, mitochondrial [Cryptomeria japonica]|uniref:pentatricopeptide repeat-containing protein At3g09040, mitochondrial n=1 Tax=Cryptomeria japonica TaxID=3369 RepID=UPI0027D9E335|nr:pentatricopeptide repeat-containing protein At3g09040, mitochondrial [Cryptomeria japonica]XP_057826545.2 pentatricopeptide repeat-containing protein At3g09040, mitochondrial [Cryptomeria japonica]XP_057826551.2 pentatricopeptide repeat-containing protein At3g09040, mitochondrial [Cryptomeria japonica]XP_057826559.2 pentatricopeptide repeat-containing protein At3g09040, mitochondrial [Cryptomeria japonica]XP_057826566.2 pentatricopeptide repeat-containing protein At3g09040, mitochondrial [Cr
MAIIVCLRTRAVIMFGCDCSRSRFTVSNNTIHFNYIHAFPFSAHLNLKLRALSREGRLKEAPQNVLTTHREVAVTTPTFFQNNLINLYVKCGSLVEARKVFDKMSEQDCVSWNLMIAAYRRCGYPHEALAVFHVMRRSGVQPDRFTFSSILPICAEIRDLDKGMGIHQIVIESTLLSDVVVGSALIDMYAKCGSIQKAREVFDKMPKRNVVTWNVMIAGYAQNGPFDEVLRLFKEMPLRDVVSWNTIIAGCAQYGVLDEALNLFKQMPRRDVVSWNTMIAVHAQNGAVDAALGLFREMPQRNVVSWNAMIAGYAQNGFIEEALETFKEMQLAGFEPNHFTFASIITACAKIGVLEQGMGMHQSIMENGIFSDPLVASALIDMYAKCGSMQKAWKVFGNMPQRDIVSWNAMIAGYVQNELSEKAFETFKEMQFAGILPDHFTFASILPACAGIGALEQGLCIHKGIIENGFCFNVVVASALIDMYAKSGSMQKAQKVFDDMPQRNVVSWNTMITGYVHNGSIQKSLEIFKKMQLAAVQPDQFTFASILPACAKIGNLEEGINIHRTMMENNLCSDVVVSSALVDMYARCGSMKKAQEVFDNMPQRNVVSWTAMIAGYAHNGDVRKAFRTLKKMQLLGVQPDQFTFASIITACAKLGVLEQGMDIHQSTVEGGFSSNVVVASALVDMYAKCGSIQKARQMFDEMSEPDAFSWSAMIAGYAMHGFHKDALELFDLIYHSGTCIDHVSFICVLFACSHAGLVNEGCKYFNGMSNLYCIMPTMDHYVCMVDLLGRAGYLEETLNFIIKMPVKPAMVVWKCLLGACKLHKNIGLGVYAADLLFAMDSKNAAPYVLLSSINAEISRWDDAQKLRRLMKDRGINKIAGCSWIEVQKIVHSFCIGDIAPTNARNYAKLEEFSWEMKLAG